jgi:tripartite-type tricarboxylate transporter receptor subunit TctC
VIDRLNAEIAKAVDAPKAKESFLVNAAEALKQTPEVMQSRLEADAKTWAEVVRVTGVKLN